MVTLRATGKVQKYLPPAVEVSADSDTALGDWYVNRVFVGRQPLLLLVSELSLLAVVVPARDARTLPLRLRELVGARLERLGVRRKVLASELLAMGEVVVAKTNSRSVLGTMNDFAFLMPSYWEAGASQLQGLAAVEGRLAETPCLVSRKLSESFYPVEKAEQLLTAKWSP